MLAPLDRPIVCPITIGREPHLTAVDRLLDQLGSGTSQTVLVTGEAGIGKSRLVADTRAHAAERGILVLQGQCFETDRSLHYAPFVDLLRGQAEFAELLPELIATPTGADPDQQKRRL